MRNGQQNVNASINIPEWDGTPRECGEVWTLRKGSRVASCRLVTNPRGGEAKLTVDGDWVRGEAAPNWGRSRGSGVGVAEAI